MRILSIGTALVMMGAASAASACEWSALTPNASVQKSQRQAKIIETLQNQKLELQKLEIENPKLYQVMDEELAAQVLSKEQRATLSEFRTDLAQYELLRQNIAPVCAEEKSKISSCVEQLCSNLGDGNATRAKVSENGLRYAYPKSEREAFVIEQQKLQAKWK